ncbi:MAG: hypothetical protein ABI479_03320 [Gallionella sp.]
MAETIKEPDTALSLIAMMKVRAEEAAKAAEDASSKANSESGFAYNAKQNAEEHAKAISKLRGEVEADMTWLSSTKKNAEDTVIAINASRATSDADARFVAETRTAVEKEAAIFKAASEKSTASLSTIEEAQIDVATALKEVNKLAAEVAIEKNKADVTTTAMQALQAQLVETGTKVSETALKATNDGSDIAKVESEANTLLESMTKATATANATQERVDKYEKELTRLTTVFSELNKKIEGLLPNATSAGLASAFKNQKDRFKKPQRNWLITFVITIGLLLVAGLAGLPEGFSGLWSSIPNAQPENWDAILRHLTIRLPFIAPLVWLGIYAGRNYMLALRVEEEYAFKEAVSTAFEGYKREMADISASRDNESPPLVILCENVLLALAQRPGRIYEGKHEDITPLSPVRATLRDVQNLVKTTKPKE